MFNHLTFTWSLFEAVFFKIADVSSTANRYSSLFPGIWISTSPRYCAKVAAGPQMSAGEYGGRMNNMFQPHQHSENRHLRNPRGFLKVIFIFSNDF